MHFGCVNLIKIFLSPKVVPCGCVNLTKNLSKSKSGVFWVCKYDQNLCKIFYVQKWCVSGVKMSSEFFLSPKLVGYGCVQCSRVLLRCTRKAPDFMGVFGVHPKPTSFL